jgi:excinuclease ABC subunit C
MFAKPIGIPRQSGCYLFRNESGTVIYVGKARSLAQRLSNYFQKMSSLDAKTQNLMTEATSVEWIVTPSELDALVLENELIKENQPRYNMRLKDDKTFPYVAIDSRTDYPVPYITRGKHQRGVRYFGPFVDVGALRRTIDEMLHVFPLRSCTKHKYNYQQRINRPCLLFDIGKCPGPCVGAVTPDQYAENVDAWARFFDGDVRELRTILNSQMTEAAAKKHYEAAAKARDAVAALERAASTQSVVLDDYSNIDVLALAQDAGRAVVVRFKVRHGRIIGRTVHHIDRSMAEDTAQMISAVVGEIYTNPETVPSEIVLANDDGHSPLLDSYVGTLSKRTVKIVVPQRGKKRRVAELALADAAAVMQRDSLRRQSDHNIRSRALNEIASALQMITPPFRMECFDMSHLQGTNYVGSMVVFEDGVPQKAEYRHFNVKEVLGNDDAGAMQEVLRRRLRYWNDDQRESKFRRADLIIIDGGLPQLNAVLKAVKSLGLEGQVPLCAIAKREELIYVPGHSTPIALERGSEGLYMVQRIRDEAHRFAITFHRSKRGKSMVASTLEGVVGLGHARRERLMEVFGSLEALRAATLAELEALAWLPDEVARRLYDHLQGPRGPRLEKGSSDD